MIPIMLSKPFSNHISGIWHWENNVGAPKSPVWTVPIHILISLIFATLLTIYVEEPIRKKLKEWKLKK